MTRRAATAIRSADVESAMRLAPDLARREAGTSASLPYPPDAGAVSFMFDRVGSIVFDRKVADDEAMLEFWRPFAESSLPAASQAGKAEGGEAGRHRHPGRGLGNCGRSCWWNLLNVDLAIPDSEVGHEKRIRAAVERAAATAAAASDTVVWRVSVIYAPTAAAPAVAAAPAPARVRIAWPAVVAAAAAAAKSAGAV
jgi:hypothetical protein